MLEGARKYVEIHGSPMLGKTHSEGTKRKIAERAKGRKAWNAGKKMPNISAAHMGGGNPMSRRIEFRGVQYPSIADAARETGFSPIQIRTRLKKGEGRYMDVDPQEA